MDSGTPPVVVWDEHCSCCRRSVRILQALDTSHRLHYQGSADHAVLARLGVTPESADEEMKLVEGAAVSGGYDALARITRYLPLGWLAAPVLDLQPVRWAGRRVYRWIAEHRSCRI